MSDQHTNVCLHAAQRSTIPALEYTHHILYTHHDNENNSHDYTNDNVVVPDCARSPLVVFLPITTQSTQAPITTPAISVPRSELKRADDIVELPALNNDLESRLSSLLAGNY